MNAQQLKNSILQEAIEGRLVPQDPNDEPASVLLERIRKEKAKLVKEGKLKKKDLEETPISKEEIPFEIPKSWKWVRLYVLFNFIDYRGSTPNKTSNGIPLVTAKNVKRGYNDYTIKEYISYEEFESRKSRGISKKGDILFTTEAPLGNVSLADLDVFSAGQRLITLQAYSNSINNKLIMLFMLSPSFMNTLLEKKTGTTVAGIKASTLKDVIIPIPPLAEQHRIVAKIEELLPEVEEYGKAQEALDKLNAELPEQLKKSILQEAIEGRLVPQDPNDEPASVLLEKIRKEKKRLVKEGKLKKKDLEETPIGEEEMPIPKVTGWEYVRLSFVTSLIEGEKREGDYVCLDAKYLRGKSSGDMLSMGKFVKQGDNIILVDGENSGEVFTVPCDGYMGSTFKQLWVSDSIYLPFILYYIRYYKDILRNNKKGAAIPHLNKEIFANLVLGIPPLQEQHRIVLKIEQLLNKINQLKE